MEQKRRALLLVSLEVAVVVRQQHLLRRWSNCPKIDRRSQHGHLHWHSQVAASPKQDTIGTGGVGAAVSRAHPFAGSRPLQTTQRHDRRRHLLVGMLYPGSHHLPRTGLGYLEQVSELCCTQQRQRQPWLVNG
jgi:hypothetical protein